MLARLRSLFTQPQITVNITINTTSDAPADIAQQLEVSMLKVINKELRPGGRLFR